MGHWVCPQDVFLQTLHDAGIEALADVRAQPGSRRSPHFSIDVLPTWLGEADVDYRHLSDLAGRRPKQPDAPAAANAAWQNQSFKNYADYTLTSAYESGLTELTELAHDRRTAIMCGEPMPWRCHRLLISNTLTARGWTVWHLSTTAAPRRHELGAWGATPHVTPQGLVTYPIEAQSDS